jgi:hypothetical protein
MKDERVVVLFASHDMGDNVLTWENYFKETFPYQSFISLVVSKSMEQEKKAKIIRDITTIWKKKEFKELMFNTGILPILNTEPWSTNSVLKSNRDLRKFITNNNILLGIIGRGDGTASSGLIGRSDLICGEEDKKTIPDRPSGAQPCPEVSPQQLMKTSAANVDDFTCPLPSVIARNLDPLQQTASDGQSSTASLINEVWEGLRRTMTIKQTSHIYRYVEIINTEMMHYCMLCNDKVSIIIARPYHHHR